MAKKHKEPRRLWSPFCRSDLTPEQLREVGAEACYVNNLYQVDVRRMLPKEEGGFVMTYLSIKRRDKRHIRDWRDFQRIKNEIVGPEAEGIEIFPAESRLTDTCNQYHMWVFPPGHKLPFGFEGRVVGENPPDGAVQRPFQAGERPPDIQDLSDPNVVEKLGPRQTTRIPSTHQDSSA